MVWKAAELKKLIRSVLSKFGLTLVQTKNIPYLSNCDALDPFFSALKGFGFAPKHILDVGANRGNWTRTALKYFPNARFTLVEPQAGLKNHIQDLVESGFDIQWINAGASDTSGSMPLNISGRDDASTFVLSGPEGESTGSRRITVDVKTLNAIVSGNAVPEMVKIDTEGLDLKVLAGASNLLGKTDIFLVEAMVCGTYENSVAEVIKFMSAAGYRLIDITEPNRTPKHGVLWLCELAFLRNGSTLLGAMTSYE